MKIKLIAAALLLTATAAPAFADNTSVCLEHRDIDGWGARDNKSMIVNDRFGRKYLLSLAGLCSDLNFSFGVGIRSFGGFDGGCVERGDHVVMRGGGAFGHNDTCWVTKVEHYTPEMQKADHDALEAKRNAHT
jgi:hypothetical protein